MMKFAITLAVVSAAAISFSGTFQLGEAVIVRANRGTAAESSAANELAYHLKLISGSKVTEAAQSGAGLSFVFAKPDGAPKAGPFESRYRIDGNRVWFWGDETNKYPGSRFAVYTFLSDELGVKWVFPGEKGITYRRAKSITIPDVKEGVFSPRYRLAVIRAHRTKTYMTPGFPIMPDFLNADPVPPALRLTSKEAAGRCAAVSKWLDRNRKFSKDPFPYGHAFTKWQDRFIDTHPEYFALHGEKGKLKRRFWDGAWSKLCISNPAVVDQIIADWQAAGTPRYINVCENDGAGLCVCENCVALDCDKPGEAFLAHKTDRYLNFWNRVAAKAKAIRPDVQITAYIYSYYRHPPRRERIEHPDNMIFGTVPSLADDYRTFFESWRKVGMKQFFLRPNFHAYLGVLPRGVEKKIYDVYKYAVEHGLVGVDFDSSTWRYVMAPEHYITSRMVAEPEKTFDELMGEFCAAYGAAADDVAKYYERIRERAIARSAAAKAEAAKANVLDDSRLVFAQARMHSEKALLEDLELLKRAREKRALTDVEASRMDDLIARAEGYVHSYRFLLAGADKSNRKKIARAAAAMLDFRIKNRDALMDIYEQVMNSRVKGPEGNLLKLVQEELKERGGMTPRTGLKAYNY